jgi:hypothetical protein
MAKAIDLKAKAKRQKIIAAVGGVILIALLAWRVPPMLALMNQKPPARSAPATAAPAPPTPGTPVAPAVPPAQGELVDSDPAPQPGTGQLVSFDRFVSKDPFAQQTGQQCTPEASAAQAQCAAQPSPSEPRAPVKTPDANSSQPSGAPSPSATRASAQISIDGSTEGVAVGATFPAAEPVFKLVSVASKSAKVAIDGGTYADGATTITLKKGEPVTLVNTADGTRYRILLVSTS